MVTMSKYTCLFMTVIFCLIVSQSESKLADDSNSFTELILQETGRTLSKKDLKTEVNLHGK